MNFALSYKIVKKLRPVRPFYFGGKKYDLF